MAIAGGSLAQRWLEKKKLTTDATEGTDDMDSSRFFVSHP
jgi:hypothetical protein